MAFARFSCFIGLCFLPMVVVAADPDCDLNGDAMCDIGDIDLLSGQVKSNRDTAPIDPTFDLNGDGIMNLDDRDTWLLTAAIANGFGEAYHLGDTNLDGFVSAIDLMVIGLNWQSTDGSLRYSDGDFDMDSYIGAKDLNLVGKHWQQRIPVAADVAAVPEPASFLLLIFASMGLWHIARRYRVATVSILLGWLAFVPIDRFVA